MLLKQSEWSALLETLINLTEQDKVRWMTSDSVYSAEVGTAKYQIGSVDEDEQPPYFLSVTESGEELDIYEQPSSTGNSNDIAKANRASLFKLKFAIERQVKDAPARIAKLMSDLEAVAQDPFAGI
ncbi:hypothetical protein [Clavibacter michiganensis]|uniref:hypothetical protein n=1 Tax=Clavibacter michiganensis TaxID=28447 RepID=UPI0011AFEAD6|nr:hypothetical protein [Clavibacter michiganensis]